MYIWLILLALLIVLALVMIIRALTFGRPSREVDSQEQDQLDAQKIAGNLSRLIQIPTISKINEEPLAKEFKKLHKELERTYPQVHQHMQKTLIAEHSLLYRWQGSDPDLKPICLMGHQDVVPVSPEQWSVDPFSGKIDETYIWGRGTLDVKCHITGLMDAAEYLLSKGFQPTRTIYFSFGHDEEIGGSGAIAAVKYLKENGIELEAVLDEGGTIKSDGLAGVDGPVALIGIAEKGYADIILTVTQAPGHSSAPPASTAIGIISKAITLIEASHFPYDMDSLVMTYEGLGKSASFFYRFIFGNIWLFKLILPMFVKGDPRIHAMIHTTTAATIIKGGNKENILPDKVTANVNCRVLPGESVASTVERIKKVVDDPRVEIKASDAFLSEPSPFSPMDTGNYTMLEDTIHQVFGDLPITPYLMMGGTDSRQFTPVCDKIYRFSPMTLDSEGLTLMHGIDERIPVDTMEKMVHFFISIIRAWSA